MDRSDEAERSTEELLADVDRLTDESARSEQSSPSPPTASDDGGGLRSRLPRFGFGGGFGGRPVRPRSFLGILLLSTAAMLLGSALPFVGLIGMVGQFVGLLAAGFAVGIVGSRRRYLEVGLAGALAAGVGFVLSTLTSAFFPFAVRLLADYGVAIAGLGAATGALAALVGHYFGRDLRHGLTREL